MHCESCLCASKSTREKERFGYENDENASGAGTISVTVLMSAIPYENFGKVGIVLSICCQPFTRKSYSRYRKTIQKPEEQYMSCTAVSNTVPACS